MADLTDLKTIARIHLGSDLSTAETICSRIIEGNPLDSEALHLMGVIFHQKGENQKAIRFILRAITVKSTNANYYNDLGSVYRSNGMLEKAKNCYRKALMLNKKFPEALFNIAGIYYFFKDYDLALECYRNAVAAKPSFPEALNNMAATLNMQKKYTDAIPLCEQAIKLRPNYNEAFNNMANAYKNLGKLTQAIELYKKAIRLSGGSAEIFCNLANAYQETGSLEEATKAYEKAIRLNPSYSKAYTYLGTILRSKRKLKEAESLFRKSMQMAPDDDETYHNMGNLYFDQGDFHSAALWYERAISINPKSTQTYINLGITYQETDQSDAAISCFEKVLALDPDNSKVHSHIIHELNQRCEWSRVDALNLRIDLFTEAELNAGRRPNEMPFLNLIRRDDPFINYQVAKHWSSPIAEKVTQYEKQMRVKPKRKAGNKIAIGYLSNNFRNHPTAHLISDIFQLHDKDRFTINVYSYGEDDGSLYRRKIEQNCDVFVDLRDRAHADAARQIYDDHMDILVDLVGYMRGHRLEICACHPAPIQVRWLGLAGSTGADFFDYLITDRIVTPEGHAPFYSENFVYMPDTYQANSKPLRESTAMFDRGDLGLPEHGFVFCCFCSSYKIEPMMFRNWMEILKKVPGSVLWLLKSSPAVAENLRREASTCGIEAERLIFADKVPIEDHLQRIRHADLGLDTRIVNGAATTSDALRACVPVLTMKGSHFASRMSASILNAIGLGEFVVETGPAYVQRAVELGNNPLLVEDIKAVLKINTHTKPLFDTHRFVRNLETAYIKMWERHRNGKAPEMFRVSGG